MSPLVTSVHPALGGYAVSLRLHGKEYMVSVKNGMVTHYGPPSAQIGAAALNAVKYAQRYGVDATVTASKILSPKKRKRR